MAGGLSPQGWAPHLARPHRPLASPCSLLPEGHLELTATCNADCSCRPELYSPVCGSDGLTYFSPCHAGCPDAAEPGPGGPKVSAATTPSHLHPGGPAPPSGNSAVCAPRCTEAVAVSLRMFPLVLAMLLQGNALQLVKESPSFWFSYSL